jgi:hypothetical protein
MTSFAASADLAATADSGETEPSGRAGAATPAAATDWSPGPVSGSAPDPTPDPKPDPKMDQLRSLLFGSQMRDYDRRLKELGERLDSDLLRLRDEQRARTERLEGLVRVELERLAGEIRRVREERIAAYRETIERIESLDRDLGGRLEGLASTLAAETRAREGALLAQSGELLDALDGRARALDESLRRERDRLQDEKTNRDELAALFTELALRLNRELDLPQT